MSHIRSLLKRAGLTAEQLAQGTGINIRTLSHHYNTGRMPYTILYKIKNATGLTMDEIVPKHLAEYWLSLWDEAEATNKPRGKKKQNAWASANIHKMSQAPKEAVPVIETLPERVRKKALDVPRETFENPEAGTVPTIPAPAKHKKPSVADLMKAKPAPPPQEEPAPDFSNVPDEVFSTSMAPENNPIRGRKK